ncbi:hypothetical protein KY363_03855, partial [Candidatus Woesearchaeota archaeon]|nr:hypothetical protein [Candidatus Woesearchaeota archaeon]
MKRKIIQQGNHSFTLTVPIRWVKENGLDGGSEVDVSEDDSKLVISAAAGKQPGSSVAFSLNGYHERTIRNILNQSYRKGYDMITIGYETGEQLDIVRNIVRETMLGFAVTDEKPGSCTVQNIAEPSPEKFDAIMRKLFLVIKQESEDILADVKSGRMTSMARLKGNKDMVDSYTNFLRRVAINARVGGLRNSYLIFHCVSNL